MKKLTAKQKARAQARIAIAKDVIAQIKAQRYMAKTGLYIDSDTIPEVVSGKPIDLQKHLKKTLTKTNPCQVCALGSAFISCVRLYDKFQVTYDTSYGNGDIKTPAMRSKLHEFFTKVELDAIESSFELALMVNGYTMGELPVGYRRFLESHNSEDRLLWLMRTVIRLVESGVPITMKRLEQQALLSIVFDREWKDRRWFLMEG